MFLVIGTTTVDLFVAGTEQPDLAAADGFRSGNLVFCRDPLRLNLGGNGACTAFALAGLGAPVTLASAVGADPLGGLVVDWLRGRGVDLRGLLRCAEHATATSTVVMQAADRQVVYHHLGATDEMAWSSAWARLAEEASVVLATGYPHTRQMRQGGFAQALGLAHMQGKVTALDVGPAIAAPVTLRELAPILISVDYLLGNAHELTGCTGTHDWEDAATALLEAGARCVVVKQGDRGVAVRSRRESVDLPAFPVPARITAGAGDSFNAGFLLGVERGQSLADAARLGSAVAALVVSGPQGIMSAPDGDAVAAFLQAGEGRI